jgi:hypothetical protein
MICRSTRSNEAMRKAKAGVEFVQTCQIPGCGAAIPRRHLMCPRHWFEAPETLRDEVLETFAAWIHRKAPVGPYLVARLATLIAVCDRHKIDARAFKAQLARWTNKKT